MNSKKIITTLLAVGMVLSLSTGVVANAEGIEGVSTKIEQKNFVKEGCKIEGNDVTLKLGEKWNLKDHNIKFIDTANTIQKYVYIVLPSGNDGENDILAAINPENGITTKVGTFNVTCTVLKREDFNEEMNEEAINKKAVGSITKKLIVTEGEANQKPQITGNGISLNVGDAFDISLLRIKAIDKEDGNITSKVVIEHNVDTTKAGIYEVVAKVEDKDGNKATERFTVFVERKNAKPVITGSNIEIGQGSIFTNSLLGVKATDKEDGDITSKVKFTGNVDTNKPGTYKVVASVKDSENATVSKELVVTVNAKAIITGKDITINVGSKFENSMLNVKATDKEDGDVTKKVVFEGAVDTKKAGIYKIKAIVTDSFGNKTVKEFKVTVKAKEIPEITKPEVTKPEATKPNDNKLPATGKTSEVPVIGGILALLGAVIIRKK